VSPLRVVPDFFTSFHLNLLGNGTILLLFLGQELLDSASLVRGHREKPGQMCAPSWWMKASVCVLSKVKKIINKGNKNNIKTILGRADTRRSGESELNCHLS
jgi:hypothetical protein